MTAATSATSSAHVVVLDAFWLIAQVVAALIDSDDLIATRERRHLMTPAVPEIWEAMDHHDQRSLAERRIVNLDATLGRCVAMRHPVEDVSLTGERGNAERNQ